MSEDGIVALWVVCILSAIAGLIIATISLVHGSVGGMAASGLWFGFSYVLNQFIRKENR